MPATKNEGERSHSLTAGDIDLVGGPECNDEADDEAEAEKIALESARWALPV